jgi:hypothetical protein
MMKRSFPSILSVLLLTIYPALAAIDPAVERLMPDTIIMNDGTAMRGLIIRNAPKSVILQQRVGEVEISKKYIRRIEDQPDTGVYFAEMVKPGKLPPWRMIVQDLRTDDSIRSFRQIPATTITTGEFARIPYLSFRINRRVEMNVYGNPEDPVAIEFGVYERRTSEIDRFKKITRTYLAGLLDDRHEIAALYSLEDKGGKTTVGDLTFQVTPPEAPDSDGGWWISIYEHKRLDAFRVPDAIYSKNTLPFGDVNHGNGVLREGKDDLFNQFLDSNKTAWAGMIPDLRGFYRNKMGDLKLLFLKKPSDTQSRSDTHNP